MTPPPCPITGEPAEALVQTVHPKLLAALWRWSFGVRPAQLEGAPRLGLWRHRSGLMAFHPLLAGDAAFYGSFYGRAAVLKHLHSAGQQRPEFEAAAALIPDGARVLDVGCGSGIFRAHVPRARYTGLDPNAAEYGRPDILGESIEDHAARHPGAYDAAVAFQVIEHVADPRGFAAAMLRCLRPGGLLVLAAPNWPSVMTRIPNFVINAPPHHLTWWSTQAFEALAAAIGAELLWARDMPPARRQRLTYWMAALSPVQARGPHYAHRWSWHAALAFAWAAGSVLSWSGRFPPRTPPMNVMLAARRR